MFEMDGQLLSIVNVEHIKLARAGACDPAVGTGGARPRAHRDGADGRGGHEIGGNSACGAEVVETDAGGRNFDKRGVQRGEAGGEEHAGTGTVAYEQLMKALLRC